MRNRPGTTGQSITGTTGWEVYDATTGLWTATNSNPTAAVAAGVIVNTTIRDGVTQTAGGTVTFQGSLTVGEGNAATATSTISSGAVSAINITNGGLLTVVPSIQIIGNCSTPATATVSTVSVTGYEITNPGTGYSTASVKIGNTWAASTAYTIGNQVNNGGKLYTCTTAGTSGETGPSGTEASIADGAGTLVWKYAGIAATATATIGTFMRGTTTYTNGISGLTFTPGTGYTSLPSITITGDGTGASAISKISITAINITNPGVGYLTEPSVFAGSVFTPGNGSTLGRVVGINGELEFKSGASHLAAGTGATANLASTLNITGNLKAATDVVFYSKPNSGFSGTTRLNFTNSATISGNGSISFAAVSIAATKTLTANSSIKLTQSTPIILNTSGNDASNGSIEYITNPLGANAQTIATSTFVNNTVKNITINNTSGVTTADDLTISGTLTQQAGIFTIPVNKTLKITSGNSIAGSFGSSSYINTSSDALTGSVGAVQIANFTGARTLPIGNNSTYLPVTITALSSSTFTANVFIGATDNGTSNGIISSDRTKIVDAIYTLNRTSGTGSADLSLGFTSGIKGANLTTSFGIARYNGTSWDMPTGNGDNNLNVATSAFTNFGPFRVQAIEVLPINLSSFTARTSSNAIKVQWSTSTETNSDKFIVEKSTDGITFKKLTEVKSKGTSSYSVNDNSPANGINYYRLVQVDMNAASTIYGPVSANFAISSPSFAVYPNPSTGVISFNTVGLYGTGNVTISDLQGRIHYSNTLNINSDINSLSLTSLASGQYILQVSANGVKRTSKLIIQ